MTNESQSSGKKENAQAVNLPILQRLALMSRTSKAMYTENFLISLKNLNNKNEILLSSLEEMGLIYTSKELITKKTIVIFNRRRILRTLQNNQKLENKFR